MAETATPSDGAELQSPTSHRQTKRMKRDDNSHTSKRNLGRYCFVTIGATAGFRQLLAGTLQSDFLKCLGDYGYDILAVQCGPDFEWFTSQVEGLTETFGVAIHPFKYTENIEEHMLEARGEAGRRLPGCIISHGGSGTILDALKYQAPLVVVPNPTLMDDHQTELAEECDHLNWAVYGNLENLADAIRRSHERLNQGRQSITDDERAPAPYSPPPFPVPESERVTTFDWMALTCYPEELAKQQHLRQLDEVDAAFAREQQVTERTPMTAPVEQLQDRRTRLQID